VALICRARWLLILGVLVGYTVALTSLVRYFDNDEGVFYSQSGTVNGSTNGPWHYAPSRELGTPWLIAACRAFGLTVVGVRVVWILLAVTLICVAFRQAGRSGAPWAGEIGALLFGTYWVTGAYLGSFFGSLLGALLAVFATAIYLRIQDETAPSRWLGVLLGLGIAGALYMRAVETAIVVTALVVHSLVWRRAEVWRRQPSTLGLCAATVVLAFALPWAIHSTLVYGSPTGHLAAWREQRHNAQTSGALRIYLHNGLGDWLSVLTGKAHRFEVEGIPTWARVTIAVGLAGFVAAAVVSLLSWVRNRDAAESAHLGFYGLLAFSSFALFWFAVGDVNDRYALYGAAFTAVVAGHLVARGMRLRVLRRRPGARSVLLIAGVLGWAIANGSVLHAYDRARNRLAEGDRTVVMAVQRAAANRRCAIIFPGRVRPTISIATRCNTIGRASGGRLGLRIQEARKQGEIPFLLWPDRFGRPAVPGTWHVIARVLIRPDTSVNHSIYAPRFHHRE
jgi:hypothetical protein